MFKDFLPILLKSEGGYSNLSADRGGETYAGISKKNFPTWKGWPIVNSARPKQNQIIKNPILDKLIADFYLQNFWIPLKCDSFSKFVANNLCDFGVNSGITTASIGFQNVINSLLSTGQNKLVVDGKIGPLTIAVANKLNQKKLNDELLTYRANFYKQLAVNNSSQNVFLSGWLSRLTSFVYLDEIVENVKKKVNPNVVFIGVGIIAFLLFLKYRK
jgi:lysozyme family protein